MQYVRDHRPSPVDALSLASVCATDFVCGAQECQTAADGWARLHRFNTAQRRALASCLAWHPGVFRQMAAGTAGVCVRFATDAAEVALAVRMGEAPPAVRTALRELGEPPAAYGCVSVEVDGRQLGTIAPAGNVVRFSLSDPRKDPGNGIVALPGLGARREVCVTLPCLCACEVRELWTDGTYVEALPARMRLLVLGDEVAQGLACADPALTWPALLARARGLELVNQSVAGQVFQPSSVLNANVEDVEQVVVALGANYAHERCDVVTVRADVRGLLSEVVRHWPRARTCVIVPAPPAEGDGPAPRKGSCMHQVPALVREAAQGRGMQVVPAQLLGDGPRVLAGGMRAADAAGHARAAHRLVALLDIAQKSPEELRTHATQVLANAPAYALPLQEMLRRGLGEVVYAAKGCVLVDVGNGDRWIYAPDHELACTVCELFGGGGLYDVLGQGLAKRLSQALGLARREPYHVCVYEGSRPLEVDPALASCVRALDPSFADQILRCYSHPEFVDPARLRESLAQGLFLGAFENGELVGFVGEHEEGSIGILEVLPGHKRQGWGQALEAAKINDQLARGMRPWGEVFPQNRASLRLQRKLGLTVLPAAHTCYLSGDDATGGQQMGD